MARPSSASACFASNQLEAQAQRGSARVKLAGVVVNSKERITRTGSRMAWVRLSDAGGSYEVTCFSEVLGRARELLAEGNSVIVTADIRLEGETLRITANEVAALDQAAQQSGGGMRVWLQKTEAVAHIRTLLDREGKGKGKVVLIPRIDAEQDVEITLARRLQPLAAPGPGGEDPAGIERWKISDTFPDRLGHSRARDLRRYHKI